MTAAMFDDRLFADAVMARVNLESLPTPVRALGNALRTRDFAMAGGAVWTAWHLTTSNKLVIQIGTRVRNAALLAVLALLLAISTVLAGAGVTSVVRIIIDGPSPFHSLINSNGAPDDQGGALPPAFVEPSDEPSSAPGETPGNTPAVTPNDDDNPPTTGPDEDNPGGGNSGPGGTHDGGDEDNGGSGGGSGGAEDNGGSGSGGGEQGGDEASPEPSGSPEAGDDGDPGGGDQSPQPTSGDQGGDGDN